MIHVTFPDGAERAYEPGVSGLEITKSISPSLAKRAVAMVRDGELADLADAIDSDAKLEFIGRDDPRALELIRHDAAHVLAEAVQSLWPGTQVTLLTSRTASTTTSSATSRSRPRTFRPLKSGCARSSPAMSGSRRASSRARRRRACSKRRAKRSRSS